MAVGAEVAGVDADETRLARINASVRLVADLRGASACRDAVEHVLAAWGGIDVFVHCIGINDRRPVEAYDDRAWERIVATNLSSAFHMVQVVAPAMREQGQGRIIFFSSVSGRSGHRNHAPYAATKGALNQLTRVTAHEYAEYGVTVNAVAPGYMDTALTRAYLAEDPEEREALLALIPAGRFGTLSEVVDPVLFLASDRASFINGHILYIDGGRSVV